MTLAAYVWKLLQVQWRVLINRIRRARGRKLLGYVIGAIVVLGLAVGAFWLSRTVLALLQTAEAEEVLGHLALEGLPGLMLTAAFLATLMISFQVLLQALYLAGDMDFLLATPVPARAVFITKLLQAAQPNLLLFSLLMLPLLWGLGSAYGYPALYYPLAPILLILHMLGAVSLSALLVMAVARILPPRRVFEVLSFLGATLGLLCSQWYNISRAIGAQEADGVENLSRAAGAMSQISSPWSPLAWPGLGLSAVAQRNWLAALGFVTLSLGTATGLILLSLRVAQRLYYSGWARVRSAPARKPKREEKRARAQAGTRRLPLLPTAVSAILQKDFRLLRRDLRNLSQVITPLIVSLIYAFLMLSGRPGDGTEATAFVERYAHYFSILLAAFASWGLISRLAMMSFSQEGKQYWILKAAPVTPGQLVMSKWLVAFLPSAAIGWLLLITLDAIQRVALGEIVFGLAVTTLMFAGNTGIHLAFGITGAKLDWTDPRQMVSGGAGCLASLLGFVAQGLSLALFLGPPVVLQMIGLPTIVGQLVGLIAGGAFAAVLAVLPPRLVLERVRRIGEELD